MTPAEIFARPRRRARGDRLSAALAAAVEALSVATGPDPGGDALADVEAALRPLVEAVRRAGGGDDAAAEIRRAYLAACAAVESRGEGAPMAIIVPHLRRAVELAQSDA